MFTFLLLLLFNALEYVWSFIIIPFYDRVLAFKVISKYILDNIYDPDPEKSYTKVKLRHLESDHENVADNLSVSSLAKNPGVLFPTDEVANEVFNNNFSVLPNLFRWIHFSILKMPSIKKYDNVDIVVNSNDKGLRMMIFVHDLQVFKDLQKNYILWKPAVGPLTREIVSTKLN